MHIEIYTSKKCSTTLFVAATTFSKILKIDGRDWVVQIHTKKNFDSEEDAYGKIFVVAPREAVIILDSTQHVSKLVRTLAHEMVHLKQIILGQLKFKDNDTLWLGKKFPPHKSYINRPWEVEALSKQEVMAWKFEEALNEVFAKLGTS